MKEIVYVIGHRSNDAFRMRNLLLTVKWLQTMYYIMLKYMIKLKIVIVEQYNTPTLNGLFDEKFIKYIFLKNNGQYNRGWAFNVAYIEYNCADFYFFSDNDIIISNSKDMKYIFKNCFKYDAISPYSVIYDTDETLFDENHTFEVHSFNKQYIEELINNNLLKIRDHTCLSGGILGMTNRAVKQISGWDERFRGRGWEDYAMTSKINLFIYNKHIFDVVAIHLWHPTMDLNCDKENNRSLNIEYGNYTLDHYLENIIQSQSNIGCKNKYNTIYNNCYHCAQDKKKLIKIADFSPQCIKIFNRTLDMVSKYHKSSQLAYVYNTLCEQHYCDKDCENSCECEIQIDDNITS